MGNQHLARRLLDPAAGNLRGGGDGQLREVGIRPDTQVSGCPPDPGPHPMLGPPIHGLLGRPASGGHLAFETVETTDLTHAASGRVEGVNGHRGALGPV